MKKLFIRIGIALGCVWIAFVIYVIWTIIPSLRGNITDVAQQYSASMILTTNRGEDSEELEKFENRKENNELEGLHWYDTVEEAIWDDSIFGQKGYESYKEKVIKYIIEDEFFRVKFQDRIAVFYLMPNGDNKKETLVAYILCACDGDKISQPYLRGFYYPRPGMGDKFWYYDCDDAVVDYIILELLMDRALDENKIQMFWGAWPNKEELESLTIAGIPLEVLDEALIIDGEEYYFWYLRDLSWTDRLSEIPWSNFTYGDVIEILDVKYEPANADEK